MAELYLQPGQYYLVIDTVVWSTLEEIDTPLSFLLSNIPGPFPVLTIFIAKAF